MSHRARAGDHDQSWRSLPVEEQNYEQERWLREEKKALERWRAKDVSTTCPVCSREFIGNERAAVVSNNDGMALVHLECIGREDGRIIKEPSWVTEYSR